MEWQITTTNGSYQKVPNKSEDNWVWSPTGVIDMHRPEMWGVLQFTARNDSEISPSGSASKTARETILAVYYAQRDFWNSHQRWATNFSELASAGWVQSSVPPDVVGLQLTPTADGYVCSAGYKENQVQHTWRIRQDRLSDWTKRSPWKAKPSFRKRQPNLAMRAAGRLFSSSTTCPLKIAPG